MLRSLIIYLMTLSSNIFAASDQLLITRSTRPLMAEASLESLSHWETPLEGFFVRTHHNTLPIKVDDSWLVSIEGLVKKPQKFSIRALKKRPLTSFHAVLECSGNGRALFEPSVSGIQWKRGAIGNAEWRGLPIKDFFANLGIKPEAKFATFEGIDEPVIPSKAKFVRSIPIKLLFETGAILAFEMNREALPIAHGGPVRLVMPNIYGQNWVKWVNKINFSAEPDSRTYAAKAYRMPTKTIKPGDSWDPSKEGKPIEYIKVQTIFTDPAPGESILPGKYTIRGKTLSGTGPVTKVEISTDNGKSWNDAKLTARKDHSWQEFEMTLDAKEGTAYEALARATDVTGNTQPLTQEWNPKGYLYNAVDRLSFRCATKDAQLTEGLNLAKQYCLTCHSAEIIEQQKLTKSEWVNTIKKMSDYGLMLESDNVEKIANSLSERPSTKKLFDQDYASVDLSARPETLIPPRQTQGLPKRGQKLFTQYCAACHGADGRGQNGPRLKGRAITDATIWSTVRNGKRLMPAFKDQLTTRDIEDIRAWLQK